MAQTIVQPQCSVSPPGSGTISYRATSSGTFDNHPSSSQWQNFEYTATPAPGYRFARFHITGVLHWSIHYPDYPEYDDSGSDTADTTRTANPYESNLSADGGVPIQSGGAWWLVSDNGWSVSEQSISSISIVAEFERVPPTEGPYLLYDDSTNQLIYAPSNGQLVYGGIIT